MQIEYLYSIYFTKLDFNRMSIYICLSFRTFILDMFHA